MPGIILALAQPEKKWTLLDAAQKKIKFLRHIKYEFGMDNIEIIHSRVEQYKPVVEFDTVICRAFAPLRRLLSQLEHLITSNNQLLAIKGENVENEYRELSERNFQIELFDLPSSDLKAKSKLAKIQRQN